MSINDLLDSEVLIPSMLIIFVVIMVFAIPIGIALGKKTNDDIYGTNDSDLSTEINNAKIIARRTSPHPMNNAIAVNMVVFELETGRRVELAIKDSNTFGIMIEGDRGVLKHQGKKFISFTRYQ